MKKLFYLLMFLIPIVACAQQDWAQSSPSNFTWKYVGNAGFSEGQADFSRIVFSPSGIPFVVYSDWGNNKKVTVMKFNGVDWINVGNAGFSPGQAEWTSLAFSPSGQPYVAFEDFNYSYSHKATVMKYDGSQWVLIGNEGFSAGQVESTIIAFSSSGEPFVAFSDVANENKVTVMKFNGIGWIIVGNAGFSSGNSFSISLTFNNSDIPYVAFSDGGNYDRTTVMKFQGGNWLTLGQSGFAIGDYEYTSLTFSPSGEPFVANNGINNQPSVFKFDGAKWSLVGDSCFSQFQSNWKSIAFNPIDSQLYVAYVDYGHQIKSTVKKFDGNRWKIVGNAGFSASTVYGTSLAFSPFGEPYVVYADSSASFKTTVMKYDSIHLGINEPQESRLSLYPNPATDKITIETSPLLQKSQLSISNLSGQQLITRQLTQPKTQIDISSLPNGVYFVRLTSEKTVAVGKFVKE